MAACDKVLQTYELLENILLHLPLYDILHSQAVCTEWRAVTGRSRTIRRVLRFDVLDEETFAQHVLLDHPPIANGRAKAARQWRAASGHVMHPLRAPILNPLLIRAGIVTETLPLGPRASTVASSAAHKKEFAHLKDGLLPDVDWVQMQAFQPRVNQIRLRRYCSYWHLRGGWALQVTAENGIRVGDLLRSISKDSAAHNDHCPEAHADYETAIYIGSLHANANAEITGWELLRETGAVRTTLYTDDANGSAFIGMSGKQAMAEWMARGGSIVRD
ncbi:hypothetical protein BAUCODRAFT_255288 [Baudoinia panamericana UAMH 10762]|uniref:F-box domain-containing protein n=1 Tax=Baudoinia panamericana (strain UAMH 10762) TaxID=717646 RepID=M2LF09_BAUPA|nr:uncharacterized protein BAUCODRAFT_255288 [Baudoinia panamericana UAMH 10762]EMC92607.1 hypothetical protein BAUCODRAFT_255288 [Baudoinia panamericana UAMH 10762]